MVGKPNEVETRGQQLFPVLTVSELHRLRRFGIIQQYLAGEAVIAAGERVDGLLFILSGTIAVTVPGVSDGSQQVATYGPGAVVGELADLSGRISLITAKALDPLCALAVSVEGLHAALKGAAEVGERIMRALIMRYLGLSEIGCAIIIGPRLSGDVARLEIFLRHIAHAQRTLDPGNDEITQTLIERFRVDDCELPIVLCPNGRFLRNPSESALALAMGVGTAEPDTT